MPCGKLATRRVQHERAERDDQPSFFRYWDELTWGDETPGGVLPSDQRLDPMCPLRLQVEDGLVIHVQFLALDRAAQVRFQFETRHGQGPSGFIEQFDATAAVVLRPVHCG